MHQTEKGLAPMAGYLEDYMINNPQLQDRHKPVLVDRQGRKTLVTPLSRFGARTRYQLIEYEQLLDSSNMGVPQWIQIASDVERYYHDYDGFIIIHGTDTMAYTASVLSFMFQNLSKPVVLTGYNSLTLSPPNPPLSHLG